MEDVLEIREFLKRLPRWYLGHAFPKSYNQVFQTKVDKVGLVIDYHRGDINQAFAYYRAPYRWVIQDPSASFRAANYNPKIFGKSPGVWKHSSIPFVHSHLEIMDFMHEDPMIFSIIDPSYLWNRAFSGMIFEAEDIEADVFTPCRFIFCYCESLTKRYPVKMETVTFTASHISFTMPDKISKDVPCEVYLVVGGESQLLAYWTTDYGIKHPRVTFGNRNIQIQFDNEAKEQILRGFQTYVSPNCKTIVTSHRGGIAPVEFYEEITTTLNKIIQVMYHDFEYDYLTLDKTNCLMTFSRPGMRDSIPLSDNETILPMPVPSLQSKLIRSLKKRVRDLKKKLQQVDFEDEVMYAELLKLLAVLKQASGDKDVTFMNQTIQDV